MFWLWIGNIEMDVEEEAFQFLDEVLLTIFGFLDAQSLIKATVVCKQWERVSKSPELWKRLFLVRWPSQKCLYENVKVTSLDWYRAYQEFAQKSWFSPDNMKYFISCKTVEDEPVCLELREAMFILMSTISEKWLQVYPYEHDEDMVSRFFDKNMELYYDTCQLQWGFLDRRRGYVDDIFSFKTNRRNKKSRHIRPYQVMPSCLIMFRWLCLFRSYATAEVGLTFYRIWRFRLKHLETGMIFELYDWKAAMSSTFSSGLPKVDSFRDDALELLGLLSHPHFIMHPLGLRPRLERSCHYLVVATAGGLTRTEDKQLLERQKSRRRRVKALSPVVSPIRGLSSSLGQNTFKAIKSAAEIGARRCHSDTEDDFPDLKRTSRSWAAFSSFSSSLTVPNASQSPNANQPKFNFEEVSYTRQSSCGSLQSDTEEERSERESDLDSELEGIETGYVSNCEYFIVTTHNLDIEEQHSLQASISDAWMSTRKTRAQIVQVLYDAEEASWYFENDWPIRSQQSALLLGASKYLEELPNRKFSVQSFHRSISDVSLRSHEKLEAKTLGRPVDDLCSRSRSLLDAPDLDHTRSSGINKSYDSLAGEFSPPMSPYSEKGSESSASSSFLSFKRPVLQLSSVEDVTSVIEPIPSCLALYRLICLFDLNCSMYTSPDDSCVWEVSMIHKKTGGIVHFRDYNGMNFSCIVLADAHFFFYKKLLHKKLVLGHPNHQEMFITQAEKVKKLFSFFGFLINEFEDTVTNFEKDKVFDLQTKILNVQCSIIFHLGAKSAEFTSPEWIVVLPVYSMVQTLIMVK